MMIGITIKRQIRKCSVLLLFLLPAISFDSSATGNGLTSHGSKGSQYSPIPHYNEQSADRISSIDDLNLIFRHDFESNSIGDYVFQEWNRDWLNPPWNNRQSTLDITQDYTDNANPTKVMKMYYPANSLGPSEGGTNYWTNLSAKYDEMYVSYDVMFMPGFEFQQGGKLPSVRGGSVETEGDFFKPDGYDGFAGGIMFKENGRLVFYIYYPDSNLDKYGTSFGWGVNTYPTDYFYPSSVVVEYGSGDIPYCTAGEWHNITYRMVLNSVNSSGGGNFDGILEAWFDGKLVTQISHILFRQTLDLGIDCLRMVSFFGGDTDDWRNPIDEWLKIDNVMLYTYRDYIDVPRGNTLSPTNRTINYQGQFSVPHTTVPNAPSSLTASAQGPTSINLNWQDKSNIEYGFRLYRANSAGGDFAEIATLTSNVTGYTDNSLLPGTTYYYKVLAYNEIGASGTTPELSASTLNPVNSPLAQPYEIQSVSSPCIVSDYFYVPVVKTPVDTLIDCIGFDMVMTYDKNKVLPTGIVQVQQDLVEDISLTDYYIGIHDTAISISVYLNAGDPSGARFRGTGHVLAVEFAKTGNFRLGDTALFTIPSLIESYATTTKSRPAQPGTFVALSDSSFMGSLRFWSDNNPLGNERLNKDSTLFTRVFGFDPVENTKSRMAVQPDPSGNFEYNIRNGNYIQIERDIPDGTDVMQVINGIDAQMLRKVLVEDTSFIPNVYQLIAMDVNMDGVISAGDITQVNERTMSLKGDYQQAWKYDAMGASNGLPSRDWVFVPNRMLSYGENFRISKNYPRDDHKGYSRGRVPVIPNCLPLPVEDFGSCQKICNEGYKAILLGDVDGNYKHISNTNKLKSATTGTNDGAILDLSSAVIHENTIDIPVSIHTDNPVYSLDFALRVNTDKIKYQSVVDPGENLQWQAYFNEKDKTLRLTSNSLQPYDPDKSLLSLRFALISDEIDPSGIIPVTAYLNGEPENFMVKGTLVTTIPDNPNPENIKIYPNPANTFLFIKVPAEASLNLLDITGRLIYTKTAISEDNTYRLDVQDLNSGIYLVKIEDGNLTIVKKVIIRH